MNGDEREPQPAVDPLFRQEAVEEYLRGRDHGALLRVSPLWKHWAFGVLVLVFAGALVFAVRAPIGIDVLGPAVVRHATDESARLEIACLLPPDALGRLRAGQHVAVDLGGAVHVRVALTLEEPPAAVLGPGRLRAALGGEVGDLLPLREPALLVVLRVPAAVRTATPGLAPGATGVASVRVGEQTLARALLLEGAGR